MNLHGDPVPWSDSTQMTPEHIFMKQNGNGQDSLFLENRALMVQQYDTLFQQISGKRMEGIFLENSLHRLWVYKPAKSIYYPSDKDGITGRNELSCNTMRMDFSNKNLERLTCLGSPQATLFPFKPEPQPRLDGFIWWPEDRPLNVKELFKTRRHFHSENTQDLDK